MNVALFVTCLADHYFADSAADAVRLLRHLGCTVTFPDAQTCCGQPAYNAGRNPEAVRMARHTIEVFEGADAVIVPSGSCATMVKKFYPRLVGEATALADRTWELGEFIVHRLGVTALGDGLAGRRVAIHQGCHALRELRLESEPEVLLEGAGAEVVPWEADDECCGFGGLFSVKMSAVSAAMADRKLDTLPPVDWVVSGDGGCVLHLKGRSRARRLGIEFVHLATALWRGVAGDGGTTARKLAAPLAQPAAAPAARDR
ncbi:MAG: (Fe-S)-binding protein [Gemmatimonadetes bacterium]|nr:(Fe-S)-binding protein [Gemmatimonadota bacterium]MXX35776.1 (Fe-S)-binding protein [Gemmatimonadota bacterium]MYA11363.1 (Fe-S)-binding protein [Gemmatimonadota bacterium]MYD15049.1 (Fe-S)-binding protein [Gemmatimonadota bacterium]MYE69608.1 (Fe-S)-binding protein [Gemmatimonadota bacterium]